jgi:hypothetical protein
VCFSNSGNHHDRVGHPLSTDNLASHLSIFSWVRAWCVVLFAVHLSHYSGMARIGCRSENSTVLFMVLKHHVGCWVRVCHPILNLSSTFMIAFPRLTWASLKLRHTDQNNMLRIVLLLLVSLILTNAQDLTGIRGVIESCSG